MKRILRLMCVALLLPLGVAWAQDRTVTGKVTSADDGSALPGVNVVLKGTSVGTATDADGRYSISVPASAGSLVFSFIGLQTQEIAIGERSIIDVSLALDATQLSEVVIVGYGTTTKESFVGTAKSVTAANIETKSFTNVAQAMAGEVAGVTVINTSGQPGNVSTVRIRGFGSVNGNRDPLYVVDGVPLTNVSSLNSISPADITSYTVLKDATATAIYGARGSNGVIVINTRGGSSGKSTIDVEYKAGVNFNGLPRYDVIKSPEEYIALTWEGMRNRGLYQATPAADPVAFANARLMTVFGTNGHYNMWNITDGSQLIDPVTGQVRPEVTRKYNPENWNDYGFQSSQRHETNVRLSGGNEKSQHYLSLGYLNDVGYIINSNYSRFNVRTNLKHQVTKWLSASANVALNSSDQNRNGQSADSGSIFWFVDNIPSVYPLFLRDDDGNKIPDPYYGGFVYDYGEMGRNFGTGTNSIGDAHIQKINTKSNEVVGNVAFNVDFTDYLTFEARYGLQYAANNNTNMTSPFYGSGATAGGTLNRSVTEAITQNFLQMLRFNKNFGEHAVEVLAAHESNDYTFKTNGASKRKSVHPDIDDFNNFIIVTSQPFGYRNGSSLESYFAQVNYNFNQRYFFTGSIRRDGSSRFIDDKWGTFGSVGGAWILNRESFFASVPANIINHLKIKGSYGITGDQAGLGFYPGVNTFDVENLNDGFSLPPRDNGRPDLTWETAKMWQFGLEFELFNGRIEGLVDYYHKTTDNLIFDRRVGPSLGIAIIQVNDGVLVNKGVEFDLTGHILEKGDFKLDLSVNGAFNTNEIKTMPIDPATGEPKFIDTSNSPYGWAKGRSIFDYYMYEWAGVDPADGRGMWYRYYNDLNDNGVVDAGEAFTDMVQYIENLPDTESLNLKRTVTKVYSEATMKHVNKSALPKLRGGFRLSARYKGFDFGAQFVYSIGGYANDGAYASLMNNVTALNNNWHKDIHGRWQQPGDITDVPRLTEGLDVNVASGSTRWLVRNDYLGLNNVKLGYTVPQNLLNNFVVKGVNVWVAGDNLFLASARRGFNPSTSESGAASTYRYSPLTTITAGLRATF